MKFEFFLMKEITPDLFSSLIERRIGAAYSHAGIVVADIPMSERVRLLLPLEGDVIFEATVPVYRFIGMKKAINEGTGSLIQHRINIPVWNEHFALGWLKGNMGKAYSFEQIIAMLPSSPTAALVQRLSNGEGEGVCSELTVRFGLECSSFPELFLECNPDFVNPREALLLFQTLQTRAACTSTV